MDCGYGKLTQLGVTVELVFLSLTYGEESNDMVLSLQEWNQEAKEWSDHKTFVVVRSVDQRKHPHTVSTLVGWMMEVKWDGQTGSDGLEPDPLIQMPKHHCLWWNCKLYVQILLLAAEVVD